MIDQDKLRLLVKVSTLYYIDGLNQQQISDQLGISRPQVSRMLSLAKSEGIVQITIKNPFSEEQQYEQALMSAFGIKNAVVIHVPEADQQLIDLHIARAGAVLLESILKEKDIIGVMAGRTIAKVGAELGFFSRKGMKFVPLVGGWGAQEGSLHANNNAKVFGEKLNSKYLLLNAPAIVASQQSRDVIIAEQEIADVIQLARQATVGLIGIGQVTKEATIVKSGFIAKQDIMKIQSKGAVANLCTSFLDKSGNVILLEEESRMVGLSALELRNIKNVIAFASGKEKIEAIGATLRGGWIDILVTDMKTAKGVLEWQNNTPELNLKF